MDNSSYNTALGIASGWSANLSDMGKLGTLLNHDGCYGGERLLSREWVYRMSHPNFEPPIAWPRSAPAIRCTTSASSARKVWAVSSW
jgi:CubicO group peptidase (beta-lactamase class C family)